MLFSSCFLGPIIKNLVNGAGRPIDCNLGGLVRAKGENGRGLVISFAINKYIEAPSSKKILLMT